MWGVYYLVWQTNIWIWKQIHGSISANPQPEILTSISLEILITSHGKKVVDGVRGQTKSPVRQVTSKGDDKIIGQSWKDSADTALQLLLSKT